MINIKLFRKNPIFYKNKIEQKKFIVNINIFYKIDDKYLNILSIYQNFIFFRKILENFLKKGSSNKKLIYYRNHLIFLSKHIKSKEKYLNKYKYFWNLIFSSIPNIPLNNIYYTNKILKIWGNRKNIFNKTVPHYAIPSISKLINFNIGNNITGKGFPIYMGKMAILVRGLINFCLYEAYIKGYVEIIPPLLVNKQSSFGSGALPDKEDQMYMIKDQNFYLIPTAEIPLTNIYRNYNFNQNMLPLYHCAYTPCFRKEAGSWGINIKGLNRLHQFDKIELIKFVRPNKSNEELELLRKDAEILLEKLQLPYRVKKIERKDIGFPHAIQYDLEVWASGQQKWLEVSSCSNFTDFQSRRTNIKFIDKDKHKSHFVHTLNCSGLAIPRVLVAILENNYTLKKQIQIPQILNKYVKYKYL